MTLLLRAEGRFVGCYIRYSTVNCLPFSTEESVVETANDFDQFDASILAKLAGYPKRKLR